VVFVLEPEIHSSSPAIAVSGDHKVSDVCVLPFAWIVEVLKCIEKGDGENLAVPYAGHKFLMDLLANVQQRDVGQWAFDISILLIPDLAFTAVAYSMIRRSAPKEMSLLWI